MAERCERCGDKPLSRSDRYCKKCRKEVIEELKASGYLAPRLLPSGINRTAEQRENVYETKHGTGH